MKIIPLTPVDYIFTGVGSQPITFAFAYKELLDPDGLQKSLVETLKHFPMLNSQLVRNSETDYVYQLSEEKLLLNVFESDISFQKSKNIEDYITPVISTEGHPLSKIGLTQTPMGSVLSASISHALVDGFSYFHFFSSWARICRGDRFMNPSLDRDEIVSIYQNNLDQKKKITAEALYQYCGLFYHGKRYHRANEPVHMERSFISRDSIKFQLGEVKNKYPDMTFSENDIITAMLWKKYLPQWCECSDHQKTYMTCPVDIRRLVKNIPRNYFGCALCFSTASIDYHSLLKKSLGDLALLIRNSVSRIRDDYIINSLKTLETFRKINGLNAIQEIHLKHPQYGMIVTNLTRLPIGDLDFGSGTPVDFLTYAEVLGSSAILPAKDGVEVLVVHPLKED